MKDAVDSWREDACREDCFGEILECIAAPHFERPHRAGEDDWNARRRDFVVEQLPCEVQGIGAVTDDNAIDLGLQSGEYGGQYDIAVGIRHEQTVFAQQVAGANDGVAQA